MTSDDTAVAIASGFLTFFITAALVAVRGHVPNEVIVLVLALVVVTVSRWSGRRGGSVAAVMAATSFEFFFTKPYLSLKVQSADDIFITLALLTVGLVTGGLSARAQRDQRLASRRELDVDTIRRILEVAGVASVRQLERSVRDELVQLLELTDCSFTTEPVDVPMLSETGSLPPGPVMRRADGFQLPERVGIAVTSAGKHLGVLVCTAKPDVGVDLARRRTAVAAAHILGLAMAANPPRPARS